MLVMYLWFIVVFNLLGRVVDKDAESPRIADNVKIRPTIQIDHRLTYE